MTKKEKVEEVLEEYFEKEELPIQAFNTRNLVGDNMYTIYEENGITIDYCYNWNYVEIFGLSKKDFEDLKKERKVIFDL